MVNENQDKSVVAYALNQPIKGAMFGVAVLILAIFGLVHVFPQAVAAIATLVFGIALLFKGAVISSEYSKILAHLSGSKLDKFELAGGVSVEIATGLAGIILGILAILHFAPHTLISAAVIAFGAGLIMGSGVLSRLNALKIELFGPTEPRQAKHLHELVSTAIWMQILAGIAVIILGILALVGYDPLTLNLVALLILGVDSVLSGSAVSEKLLGNLHGSS